MIYNRPNAVLTCASPALSNHHRSVELFVFPSMEPLLQSAVICLQIARMKIWSRAKGNSILQHDSLGQIPHAQLPLRSKYGQHLFPDWAQNVPLLLLKWKRAWAFEHYSTGQTCQLNLCPVIRNNFTKSLIFCFYNGVCCNTRHWR